MFLSPQELSGNGCYYSKQIQAINVSQKNLTMMYHTEVTGLMFDENNKAVGVKTDKGEIASDAVVLCSNLGTKPLLEGKLDLPTMQLTGWAVTATIDPMNVPPLHTLIFDNKDLLVTRLGNRVRVCGRYWLGESSHDMTDKVIEEIYEASCSFCPQRLNGPNPPTGSANVLSIRTASRPVGNTFRRLVPQCLSRIERLGFV